MQNNNNELKTLYDRIPEVKCRPGCSDCCGITLQAPAEVVNVTAYLHERGIRPPSLPTAICPFLTKFGGCSIYPVRPLICRLLGASEEPLLQCPHGCSAEQPLSVEETRAIIRELEMMR